jgi:hypothetical protein
VFKEKYNTGVVSGIKGEAQGIFSSVRRCLVDVRVKFCKISFEISRSDWTISSLP